MAVGAADQELLQHIKAMIRRDLKLGPDVAIPDDMPFFGNDVDLDSLDMLLLVTSIEKEFGIKVPSEAVGREVFQNVSTLARYIQENRRGGSAGGAAAAGGAKGADALAGLPHREPFRFVTRLTEHKAGESAGGVWSVKGDEAFFAGHFPGKPIVPGVLIAEALAQVSGIAGPAVAGQEQGKLVHVDVRFDQAVAPPAEIVLRSKVTRVMGALQQFEVSASVGGAVVARGTVTLHRG